MANIYILWNSSKNLNAKGILFLCETIIIASNRVDERFTC